MARRRKSSASAKGRRKDMKNDVAEETTSGSGSTEENIVEIDDHQEEQPVVHHKKFGEIRVVPIIEENVRVPVIVNGCVPSITPEIHHPPVVMNPSMAHETFEPKQEIVCEPVSFIDPYVEKQTILDVVRGIEQLATSEPIKIEPSYVDADRTIVPEEVKLPVEDTKVETNEEGEAGPRRSSRIRVCAKQRQRSDGDKTMKVKCMHFPILLLSRYVPRIFLGLVVKIGRARLLHVI